MKLGPRWGRSVEWVAAKRQLCAVVVGCLVRLFSQGEVGARWWLGNETAGLRHWCHVQWSYVCTFWVREWGGLNRVVRGLEMGRERWCSMIVVAGDGSGWSWSSRRRVRDGGFMTLVSCLVAIRSCVWVESGRAQLGGWGRSGRKGGSGCALWWWGTRRQMLAPVHLFERGRFGLGLRRDDRNEWV